MAAQLSSLLTLALVVGLCASFAWWLWARRRDAADRTAAERQAAVLTGREAVARHLYGEACGWHWEDMSAYDHMPDLREPWLQKADQRLQQARARQSA